MGFSQVHFSTLRLLVTAQALLHTTETFPFFLIDFI